MKPLASVIKAKYLKDYIIDLTFDDGIRSAVDFLGWLRGGRSLSRSKRRAF
jgi:hypothetical protein